MNTAVFDVTTFTRVADAVAACATAGGGDVVFPAGVYESATIHLPGNIHLRFEEGAVLRAMDTGFDEPEENPWDVYQDFGHSHFNNGLLVADGAENITISGRRPDYRPSIDTGIIRRLAFINIEGRGPMSWRNHDVPPTIMGLPHRPIEDLTFTDVHLTVPGGHPPAHAESRVDDTGFFRARFHTDIHPSYGWWMRDVKNVTFNRCSVSFTEPDGRPPRGCREWTECHLPGFPGTTQQPPRLRYQIERCINMPGSGVHHRRETTPYLSACHSALARAQSPDGRREGITWTRYTGKESSRGVSLSYRG